jgi:hypothetical protein
VFTGSATEADNLALLGVARAMAPHKRHLIVSAVEHPAVMQPALHLREAGWDVTVLAVDEFGHVSLDDLRAALRPDTALVSVMHANNEVGTIQPVAGIAALARANGSLMHTDAAQSAGKVTLDVAELGADLLTLAGHKFYGPKGIGALYVRRGTAIRPILFGADQEHGLRPGTENVAQIVGAGETARLARSRLPHATRHLATLRDELHRRLAAGVPGLLLNGHPEQRLPNTLHVSFPGVSGRDLLATAHMRSPPRSARPAIPMPTRSAACWPPWAAMRRGRAARSGCRWAYPHLAARDRTGGDAVLAHFSPEDLATDTWRVALKSSGTKSASRPARRMPSSPLPGLCDTMYPKELKNPAQWILSC